MRGITNFKMKKKNKHNLHLVQIAFYGDTECILTASPELNIQYRLLCDLENKQISPLPRDKKFGNSTCAYSFSLFIGIINIEKHNFFLFADSIKKVGQINKHIIYEIKKIAYLPFDNSELSDEVKQKLKLLTNHFSKGYCFSYTMDLSKSIDQSSDFKELWYVNRNMQNFLIINKHMEDWCIPVIQGYFKTHIIKINNRKLRYSLLLKTHLSENKILEFNQIIESEEALEITRAFAMDARITHLAEHISSIIEHETGVVLLNTIDPTNDDKVKKIKAVQEIVEHLIEVYKVIKYRHLNIEEVEINSRESFKVCDAYFSELREVTKILGSTVLKNGYIKNKAQKGYYLMTFDKKTNSSIVIALLFLFYDRFMHFLTNDKYISVLEGDIAFWELYSHIGFDYVAAHEELQEYVNLFIRDSTYNILTPLVEKSLIESKKDFLVRNREVFEKIMEDSNFELAPVHEKQRLKLVCVTYNVSGCTPNNTSKELINLIAHIRSLNADIILFGLQEMIELKLKIKNFKKMMNSIEVIRQWEYIFLKHMPTYRIKARETCLALQTFILVKKTQEKYLLSVNNEKVKLGIMKMGNKGAIITSLNYNGIFIEFINCHLTSGFTTKNKEDRFMDLSAILRHTTQRYFYKKLMVSIFAGDFNFKVESELGVILNALKHNKLPFDKLKLQDEFDFFRSVHSGFASYSEKPISFKPTYRYIKASNILDYDKRAPAWTDRVFYRFKQSVEHHISGYDSIETCFSDHKPVIFAVDLFK